MGRASVCVTADNIGRANVVFDDDECDDCCTLFRPMPPTFFTAYVLFSRHNFRASAQYISLKYSLYNLTVSFVAQPRRWI
jgi:hypothetical protein